MFKFFSIKKSLIKENFLMGFTDYHSHILPGVDDGVKTTKDALGLLIEYEKLGVTKVTLTPHIMELYHHNNAQYIESEFAKFISAYSGNIDITLAAEYMLDSKFATHLSSGKMLTLWSDYLLIESSHISLPLSFHSTINDIKSKGYIPVLAHPERYSYMSMVDLHNLKDDDMLFQLNLLSLSGYYGKHAKERAIYLLENDMYDLIGSDIHNLSHFKKWLDEIELTTNQLKILQKIKEDNNDYISQ